MKKKIMRRWIAWLMLVIVVLGSLEFPENMLYVKAAESDEVPDYDIWMANTMMYGMENNGNGLYGRTFQNLQIPIYKELGGYLLEDKVQVGLSAFWSVYFNDEYREQFANEQKYLYEVILMDYIKNGLDEEIEVDLQNNYLEFSAELYKTLADYHFDNGISAAEFEISVEEAESILKNYSTAEGIGTAVEAVRDFADTKDKLLEAVSEYLALQRVKEEKIMLLTMAKEACIASDAIQDNDFIQAVDDIISCLQKTQIDYAYGTGRDILIEKAKSLFWKKVWDELGKKFPIFKVLELEAAGLDAIFDTSNSASGNLKLAVLYTTDCYMNMGLLRASSNFRTTASKKNASRFLSCFKGYLEFQMYGNDYAKEWMEEYLNGASMVSTSRWIFSKEQCENVQELITIGNTQKENRSKLFELIDRYAKIYRGMYGLSNPGNGTGERRELKNPIINGDGEATWDCVWFGNYWQEDTNGDGKADKNDEKQPIKWRVLSVDESSVFLLADKGLDCKTYNQSWKNVTWESCTLRSWLNGYGKNSNKDGVDYTSDNFMDQAFSSREQSDILETVVVDKDYPGYGSVVGNNTTDRVYLLSIGEAGSASYGFLTEISSKSSKTRKSKNTAYAEAQQADIDYPIYEFHEKYCEGYWWLRSPCYDFYHMAWAVGGGEAKYNYVHFYNNAVRPVLKLSLASSLWSYAGTVDSDGKVNEIQPREQNHDSSGNNETEGDTIPSGEIGIASFSTETVSEGKKDKELSFSGSLQFSNVTEISKDLLEQKVSSLDWTSNDQSIVSDAEILCMGRVADDNKSINLQISFTPKKAGVVTITGTAPDGKTASCVVTVTNPATDDLCILDFPGIQYYVQGEAILKISNAFMVINQVRCEFYADVTNIGTEPSELFIFDIYYYKPDNDSVDQRVGGILGDIRVGQTTSLTWDSDANFGKNIAMERKWNRFRIVAKDGSNMSTDALPSADTGIAESRVSSIIIDSDVSGRMNEEVSISGEVAIRKKSSESLDESKRILEDEISHLKWKSNNQSIIADKDISCDGNLSSNVTQLSGHILLGYQVKCTPKQCGQVVLTGTNKDGSVTASCKITVTVSLKYRTDGSAWVEKKGDSANIEHSYYYNDDFFYKDSRQYNNSLAVMSLGLELSSFSDPDYEQTEAQYKEYRTDNKRAGNIQDAYEKLGFDSWHFRNYENPLSDDSDKVAYSFAKKEICQGDQHDTLIAVVVRGGGYGAEWVSNFHVGNSGNAIGFDTAAKKILPELKEYIKTLNITGNLKLWITGFSRGGATANILTHYINEDLESVHSSLKNKNIFAYTFATPSGYRKSKNYDRTVDGNLWNIVSANDLVPKLALVQWGFSKYGNTLVFPEYTSGALKKKFYNYTVDELNIKNANDAEEVLTNLLYDVTLGTPGWTLEFEPKVMDGLRAGNTKSYFDKAVFVSEFIQLIDEIMHSKMGTGKLIYALSCWVGEELAYVSSLSWDDPSIAQVLGNIGYAHYPEHYLCWLEGGNSVLLKDNLYAKD
ncbi:MAG: hypothetical protein IJ733_04480, partial [Lachnospiraceae bacterium]|nr:hypothetical protein [Lachnospiraceae bacterium]